MRPAPLRDPLQPPESDRPPWWAWLLYAMAAVLLLVGVVTLLAWGVSDTEPQKREADLTFIDIEPEPEAEPEPDLEPDSELEDEDVEEEPIGEPEPEPEPEPVPVPEPEPKTDTEPEPEDPPEPVSTPKELPEGDPKPLEADERPLRVGLEAQSFDEGAEGGPEFAVGDRARGGRPTTRSVDRDKRAVEGAAEGGTGTEPARRPTARPRTRSGTRAGKGSRKASLDKNVPRDVPYPKNARERDIEASCTARIAIDETGKVTSVTSVQCDENGFGFGEALKSHIESNFKFEPELVDGEPQAVNIRWRHDFRIDY